MKYSRQAIFRLLALFLPALLVSCATLDPTAEATLDPAVDANLEATLKPALDPTLDTRYFKIHFIDAQTKRGIPLVEIKSVNAVRYISDSAGWVAISPHDIAGELLYFSVQSHGYELEADQFGFRGIRIKPIAGESKTVELQRNNIAERLYRITGEGIYHDSQLLGLSGRGSLPERANGGVFGQDSAVNVIYDDQLHWFWGDTHRGDGPLGNFEVSGAVSSLRLTKENNPADGIDLNYFVDAQGFSRSMCPIEGAGVVWISGLMVLEENSGEQMLTHYSRWEDLGSRIEQGIAVWNDEKEIFEKQVEFPLESPLSPRGHPIKLESEGQTWFYFGYNFPNIRVRATKQDILDPESYQAYTCLTQGSRWQDDSPPLERDQNGQLVCAWKADTDIISEERWYALYEKGLVTPAEKEIRIIDSETGNYILTHAGHVAWNAHRNRWIAIFNQLLGHTLLGEVWYAEASSPMGPWSAARKIVTHDDYSFYNVKQHPYFAHGPYLYFEGTYTKSFSGNKNPTPRYDYNQIMYRLNLEDTRLPELEK